MLDATRTRLRRPCAALPDWGSPHGCRRLPGSPMAAGAARRWVRLRLTGPHSPYRTDTGLVEAVVLVVSELVANAVEHTASGLPGGSVRVRLYLLGCGAGVRVVDEGPRPGGPRAPVAAPERLEEAGSPCGERGRGLALVALHVDAYGWTRPPRRCVWARVPATAPEAA